MGEGKMAKTDRSPEEIHYLLNRKGKTFADIDRDYGLKEGTARKTARHPYLAGEKALADALSTKPCQLWPRRYDPKTGRRLQPQPGQYYTDRPTLRASKKGAEK